ncbi:ribose-phosphate pyrophosphokinase [Candidatus Spongiihabitans sp.]|uniref:ribose-phosphate pyrophosphokinase n=1 Tax=Candidatus Spongiihabitans sp. TaxID=3101308 RepID=UPI003C7E7B17
MVSPENLAVFAGNANPGLAAEVVQSLGIPLGKATVGTFSDGEVNVEIMENVRGRDVFIIQPTCAPSNDNLMELLVMIDAIKRSSAGRITAVIPYLGYARQDRRPRTARVAISAKLVAEMISVAGADRVLTMDLHADQIQGFFDIPIDNIYGSPVLMSELWRKQLPNPIVISPDAGGVVRARAMAKQLETGLAIIDKRRPKANEAKVMHIIGDVSERSCILIDDIVDTANTLCEAARALKQHGAIKVLASCTHAVLSGDAIKRINDSEIDELLVTNSIPLREDAQNCAKIKQLSVAELLAESIRRVATADSISNLFID